MILSALTEIKNKLGAAGGIATLDSGGKIPSSQIPSLSIANTYPYTTDPTECVLAETGDMAIKSDGSTVYILAGSDPTVLSDWKNLSISVSIPPIGFDYIQFANGQLPGDTLLDNADTDITSTFNPTELALAHYPGTTWKLAVRNADFLRQTGTRNDGNGKTIGTTFGNTQDHQMQGAKVNLFNSDSTPSPTGNAPASDKPVLFKGLFADGRSYSMEEGSNPPTSGLSSGFVTDGINGTPNVGVETRPSNTSVRFWIRTA